MGSEMCIRDRLGTSLDDRGYGAKRWDAWRPTLSMCQQDDLIIDRLELLFQPHFQKLADLVTKDIEAVSPETKVVHHHVEMEDPWDFKRFIASCLILLARIPSNLRKSAT